MQNNFFIDSANLSEAALEKKHRLESDPSSRKNHMEYMPDMEQIDTGIRDKKGISEIERGVIIADAYPHGFLLHRGAPPPPRLGAGGT